MVLDLPARWSAWLTPQPWLQVRSATKPVLRWEQQEVRLQLVEVPSKLSVDQLRSWTNALLPVPPGSEVPVFVGAFLSQSVRDALEEQDASYFDARGHLHLVAPGVLLHLGRGRNATRTEKVSGQMTLGVHGVRAVQALLEEQGPVSVSQLAESAAISVGQTHKVLTQLEGLGLVRSTGRGPSKRRTVRERTELLDWLQRQPSAVRRERSLHVAFYARRPEELWLQSSARLTQAGIPHAFTGAAAASLFGVGPTSVPHSLLRIAPGVQLDDAARRMGADITERGTNLILLQDTGRVGCWPPGLRKGIQIAPLVRIYLDALSERRGDEVSHQFREAVLGY
ncbi:helix-turn-helix domain-containing protein [Corallococcus exiguus]|nr:helix-turn-helix domain-containing protein [Corallococcus exiguus]NRD63224.1 helix-turn-helix domain-containing protein [Corallococcus exiguus]